MLKLYKEFNNFFISLRNVIQNFGDDISVFLYTSEYFHIKLLKLMQNICALLKQSACSYLGHH